jgi:hypothetical protein
VAFLDSDDVWHPRKLFRQMLRFDSDPELGLGEKVPRSGGEGRKRPKSCRVAPLTRRSRATLSPQAGRGVNDVKVRGGRGLGALLPRGPRLPRRLRARVARALPCARQGHPSRYAPLPPRHDARPARDLHGLRRREPTAPKAPRVRLRAPDPRRMLPGRGRDGVVRAARAAQCAVRRAQHRLFAAEVRAKLGAKRRCPSNTASPYPANRRS